MSILIYDLEHKLEYLLGPLDSLDDSYVARNSKNKNVPPSPSSLCNI